MILLRIIGWIVFVGLCFGAIMNHVNAPNHDAASRVAGNSPPTAAASPVATAAATKVSPPQHWAYSSDPDPMTSKLETSAVVVSSNTFEFGFPYKGPQHARLTIRNHPKLGHDIILQINKGQMLCGFPSCQVPVRFDEQAAQSWTAVRSADGDSTVLFLRNYGTFVSKLEKAKVVRLQPTIYDQGLVVMEFPVEGFDSKRYAKGE